MQQARQQAKRERGEQFQVTVNDFRVEHTFEDLGLEFLTEEGGTRMCEYPWLTATASGLVADAIAASDGKVADVVKATALVKIHAQTPDGLGSAVFEVKRALGRRPGHSKKLSDSGGGPPSLAAIG